MGGGGGATKRTRPFLSQGNGNVIWEPGPVWSTGVWFLRVLTLSHPRRSSSQERSGSGVASTSLRRPRQRVVLPLPRRQELALTKVLTWTHSITLPLPASLLPRGPLRAPLRPRRPRLRRRSHVDTRLHPRSGPHLGAASARPSRPLLQAHNTKVTLILIRLSHK